jgi:hypothetical protein
MTSRPETHEIARSSGDQAFLRWIYERLLYVHHEPERMDYMRTMREFAENFHLKFKPRLTWRQRLRRRLLALAGRL